MHMAATAAEGAAAEIAAALRLTRRSADGETSFALDLARRVPDVLNAFLFGRIDLRRARVLVDGTLHVDEATARRVVDSLLDDAPQLTTSQLRDRVRKQCLDLNPTSAQDRYEWAVDERRLVVEANESGTANLMGLDVPPHIAQAIKRRIHREAMKLRRLGDDRTMDQLRVDIFLDLLRQRTTEVGEPGNDAGGVHVDTDLATLAGLENKSGHLNGYGPVIADVARQVAEHQENGEWRWTLRDPDTGQPIDGGIIRRRPTRAQRRKVETVHTTCTFPGCRMPSVDCDIDHRTPWAERQITCTDDLSPLCRHHHRIRHAFGWGYEMVYGGDVLFTSPFSHQYTTSGQPP